MAIPANKTSKARKNSRRSAVWKLSAPALVECPQCHTRKLAHRVCPNCGYYDGKKVMTVKADKEEK
ncbi:MAG: 50S ribosomal protein L32 [Eubacteriales bacterium]|nr:50S ribosomal protein L32 [Eubacteriales bacterium]